MNTLAALARPPLLVQPLAHLVPTGLGPWGDGMARLVLQPTDLLLVLALVLLAAQAEGRCAERLPLLLPLAWLLGGLGGFSLAAELSWMLPCTIAVTALGLLVTLGVRWLARIVLPGAAGLALLFGLAAGSTLAGHAGGLAALAGEAVAIAVLTTLLLLPLAPPRRRWLELGLRVIGSWIAATGLLMLGWLVRHPQGW
jgi:hydrogenase/urease accessory protein HupE